MEDKFLENFIDNLETRLNERDKTIKQRDELIKEVKDFETLLPELNQVIQELEEKYKDSNDKSVQEELNSYLKEREDYWNLIQSMSGDIKSIDHDVALEDKLIADFYQKREIEHQLKFLEKLGKKDEPTKIVVNADGEFIEILASKEPLYQRYLLELDFINQTIMDDYEKQDFEEAKEENVSMAIDFQEDIQKTELETKQKELLEELLNLEKASGKKQTFTYPYHGEMRRVSIPRRLVGKYRKILSDLKLIEKRLENYIPKVQFESQLYEGMTVEQRKCYLANLMLQIEVRANSSLDKVYVQGKYVPREYQELYEKIISLLKQEMKQVSEYTHPIEWAKVSTLSVEERRDYFKDLLEQYAVPVGDDTVEINYNGTIYVVTKSDVPAFKKCYEEYGKACEELKEEKEEFSFGIAEEEYVAFLDSTQKQQYYERLLHEITQKPIFEKVSYTVNGVTYEFDKNYLKSFVEIATRYDALFRDPSKEEKYEEVVKVKKPSFLGKIKKALKKKTVQIALAVVTYAAALGVIHFVEKHYVAKEESSLETVQENENPVLDNQEVEVEKDVIHAKIPVSPVTQVSLQESSPLTWETAQNFEIVSEDKAANLFINDEVKSMNLLYPDDSYRIVSRNYEMPNQEQEKVSMTSPQAMEEAQEIEAMGGVLKSVDAVAFSGEEDYQKNKIPTGTFVIDNNLQPSSSLDQEVIDTLNQGRGR